ncbi:TadE family protein [Thalassotalea aquiviva]|uniref:TadE family protein n=1 Tax=Thalassotalea aquiviva TaxID=3242415 RepID=UPI00352AAF53
MNRSVQGVYTVEFAVVGSIFFLVLFAVLEVSRLMYTWSVLTEVSRRGARLAAVCNILTDPGLDGQTIGASTGIAGIASFEQQSLLPNFSANNVAVSYLTLNGSQATHFSDVRLVRVTIQNYQHNFLLPGFSITLNSPDFSTTIPRESLGVSRYDYTSC